MPKKDYPTYEIKGYARDVTGYSYPIRRGFYDNVSNKGFGFDKIYHKHGIKSIGAIQFVFRSPQLAYQGPDVQYTAYANKLKCNAQHTKCTVVESYKVLGIATKNYAKDWHTMPVNGVLGVKTVYCVGPTLCPSWVTGALDGTLKPLSAARSMEAKPSTQEEITMPSYVPIGSVGTKTLKELVDDAAE